MSNTNYGGARSDTLLMDFDIYNQRRIGMLSAVEKLEFDTRPAQMEGKVCGTEAIMELMSQWNRVAKTSMNFRDFYMGCVDPSLRETADSINTTNDQVANALNIFGNPTSAIKNIQGKDTLYEMLVQQKNGDVDTVTGLENVDAKDYLQLAALKAAASNVTKLKAKIFASDKEAAEYLDSQMKVLCDDDDSNDAEAIVNINATLQGFLHEEVVGGKRYVAYDQEKILGTLKYLEKDGLAHQLLSSVNTQIDANKRNGVAVPDAITKLGIVGNLKNTKLEVRKDGAGVRLEVTSNNDLLPLNEIDHKYVAYAATEESALNYFKNGDSYDWNAISEWFRAKDDCKDIYHCTSIEYDVLATEMFEMTDEEIESIFRSAEYTDEHRYPNGSFLYEVSDKLGILIDRHDIILDVLMEIEDDFASSDKYTRAVLIDNIYVNMPRAGYINYVHISCEEFSEGQNTYLAQIDCCPGEYYDPKVKKLFDKNTRSIKVYPYSDAYGIDKKFTRSVREINKKRTAVNVPMDVAKFMLEQTVWYAVDRFAKVPISSEYWTVKEMMAEIEKINYADIVMSDFDMIDYGNSTYCMFVEGTVVHISEKDGACVYISNLEFDEKSLLFSVAAYNRAHGTNYTVDEMKIEFVKEFEQDENGKKIGNSDIFDEYDKWFSEEKGHEAVDQLKTDMKADLKIQGYTDKQIDEMSIEEIKKYLEEH